MFCRNCGYENGSDSSFCAQCGSKLVSAEPVMKIKPPKKRKKWGVIIMVEILLLVLIIVALILFLGKRKEQQYEQEISRAARYLEVLDYEKAEAAYLAAIEIDPKQETPYICLAEIYVVQEKPEKAREILSQGYEVTGSEVINGKYLLYTYVDDVLIPQYGVAQPGVYEIGYVEDGDYWSTQEFNEISGVITSRIRDFDQDGQEELLVALLRNDVVNVNYSDTTYNSVFLQMYELKGGQIILSDELEACSGVFGGYEEEADGIFLKEYDAKIYICGGRYGLRYLLADGSGYMSFAVTYENDSFLDYSGDRIGTEGSDFSWNEELAMQMAEEMEAIELVKVAEDVRDTYMLRMTYEDEVDDVLFRIEGKNNTVNMTKFYQTRDINALGCIDLHFWLGENVPEELKQEEEKVASENVHQLTEAEWKRIYLDFIIQDKQNMEYTEGWEYVSYDFAYLDGDNIPELFITYQSTAAGCKLATIYDQTVHEEYMPFGSIIYEEYKNVFRYTSGRQGYYADDFFAIENGMFISLAIGSYEATLDEQGRQSFNVMEYYWNEAPVSKLKYEEYINFMINPSRALNIWEDYYDEYTYDEVLVYLTQ